MKLQITCLLLGISIILIGLVNISQSKRINELYENRLNDLKTMELIVDLISDHVKANK